MFNSQTHGYHSLRNEVTCLWATLPNIFKEAKDINIFKRMIVNHGENVNSLINIFSLMVS